VRTSHFYTERSRIGFRSGADCRLLLMAVDRLLTIRRRRSSLDEAASVRLSAQGTWLTVVGFCVYATTVSIVLTASRSRSIHMSLACTVYVHDRSVTATTAVVFCLSNVCCTKTVFSFLAFSLLFYLVDCYCRPALWRFGLVGTVKAASTKFIDAGPG